MEDILIDSDGNFVATANGDVTTITGLPCLVQDISHRLMTYPGDLWLHGAYGSKIVQYIQSENNELNRLELEQEIRLALMQDEKIDPETIQVEIRSWDRETIYIRAIVTPVDDYNDDLTEEEAAQVAIEIKISQGSIEVTGI